MKSILVRSIGALGAACLLVLASLGPVSAATIIFGANLDCAAANAGAGTCGAGGSGTGAVTATFDDQTNLFSWEVSWSGLSGTVTVAHFHGPATPAQNAGVEVGISTASNPSIGSATLSAGQASDLFNDLWYMNVHSTAFPGGEIRGQVNVIPVPAAVWLFGSALGLLGWVRRKTA